MFDVKIQSIQSTSSSAAVSPPDKDQVPAPGVQTPTFIFIDGSYFCFYRYYSVLTWWKHSHPEIALENPYNNDEFLQSFKNSFVKNVASIAHKLNINNTNNSNVKIIVGKDCKREHIWRHELINEYKANRPSGMDSRNQNGEPGAMFYGGAFFKMAYEENLFLKGGAQMVLKHPHLEGDDVIAVSVKYLLKKYDTCKIVIVTSDKDYLQLLEPRVQIFNLMFKNLADLKGCSNNAKQDLFVKIVMGDKSDNIRSVLQKCGPKTALKCFENPEYFRARLDSENAHDKYLLNKKMIDFDEIPQNLIDEFMAKYNDFFANL